ncbi:MAG: InlB B-repeat-containing protein [Spirochaetaceae bacterium]|jgi:uncharacterized repeat protein (TIGR02543 family)|nr:InlB B-repeat-containing protein [Spirochaetaceae bacterium]
MKIKLFLGWVVVIATVLWLNSCDLLESPDVEELIYCTVIFAPNGGLPEPETQKVLIGSKVTQPEPMIKDGYGFAGWFLDEDFTEEWDFENDIVSSSITLYASWSDTLVTVTFNANGALQTPDNQQIAWGAKVVPPIAVTKTGYILEGWYAGEEVAELWDFNTDTVTEDITLNAAWSPIKYTVRFNGNNGQSSHASTVEYTYDSGQPLSANVFSRQFHTFGGWNTLSDGGGLLYEELAVVNMANEDEAVVDLYAQWILNDNFAELLRIYILEESAAEGTGGTVDVPFSLSVSVELSLENWNTIQSAIGAAGQFIALDISECTPTAGETGALRSNGLIFDDLSSNYTTGYHLTSITFPDSVEIISDDSFYNLGFSLGEGYVNLKTVSGSGVKTIGIRGFVGCLSLENIDFPNLETIGAASFAYCEDKLISVSFPNVKTIGGLAFSGCYYLRSANFPQVQTIEQQAFEVCQTLQSVYIPNVQTVGPSAFWGCIALATVVLPTGAFIGEQAFYHSSPEIFIYVNPTGSQ